MPDKVVAVVAGVPDRKLESGGSITVKEFDRALVQVTAIEGLRSTPKPGGDAYAGLKNRAIRELLGVEWVRGQAAEMGIGLRPGQVNRELVIRKQEAFESAAQYRRYLRRVHFSHRDVIERVESVMLADRIEARAVAGIRGEAARRKALAKLVAEYNEHWRARTVCAPGYITELCSNGPEPRGSS